MKKLILFIIFISLFKLSSSQNSKTLFHLYEPTASISRIVKWNIEDTSNQRFVVKEVIDSENRVIKIQYLDDGKVPDRFALYGVNNIEFEYGDNYIIEKYLDYQGNSMTLLEDETPAVRKYILNDKNEIIGCKTIYRIEFEEISAETFLKIENSLRFWRENVISEPETESEECPMNYIYGYLNSYMKMNGVFPKQKDYEFNFEEFNLMFSDEIIKELNIKYKP